MSAETTRALMCLREWSLLGLVSSEDVAAAGKLPVLDGDASDYEMEPGWDAIEANLPRD